MDKAIACELVRSAFRVSRELQDVMGFLKANLPEVEYRRMAPEIAMAIDGVNGALTRAAVARHPELQNEIDQKLEKYGRFI